MRHPNLLRTRGSYESLNGPNGELNDVWPIRPTRGVNRGYQYGILRPDGTLARYTSVCAPTVFRGDRLPAELYGNVFVADPTVNLVSRFILRDGPDGLVAEKAYRDVRGEFLASTDELFRPVNLSMAPDGTLYVVDMYRGIVEHKGYITEYLRDYIVKHNMEQFTSRGRIYRIVHETTRRDMTPLAKTTPAAQLVQVLSHPNGWRRDLAQQMLVERGDKSVVPALRKGGVELGRRACALKALWVLDGLDAIEPGDVMPALTHANRDVRVSALRLSERWLRTPNHPIAGAVLKRLDDTDWAVRRQLAATLGELPAGSKAAAIASLLERYGDDPIAVDAALSGRRAASWRCSIDCCRARRRRRSASRRSRCSRRRSCAWRTMPGADADAARGGNVARAVAARRALRGAEVRIARCDDARNAESGRWRSERAVRDVPGGRGGPGGARAFPGALEGADPAAPPREREVRSSMLASRPALVAVARRPVSSAIAPRKVLVRVGWPGKPGMAAAAPLSAADQTRFAAGQELYKNLCEGCHGADGREQPGATPNIAGAPNVIGEPGIPIRILLHGKEGPVGLMPAHGESMSDAEIAAVLTYLRRAWGQTASPIDAASVQQIRAATAGRTRAWTPAELGQIK
jgi:mono/diheme cytochrome c family protein